jgi:hypothetical protein
MKNAMLTNKFYQKKKKIPTVCCNKIFVKFVCKPRIPYMHSISLVTQIITRHK